MNSVELVLDAMDSTLVLAGCTVVVALTSLVFLALICHVVMIPVRGTAFGQWAGRHVEALRARFRAVYAARKSTQAGAQ